MCTYIDYSMLPTNLENFRLKKKNIYIYMCPGKGKGCSTRDFMIVESCRAQNLLSDDIKYVMIG